MLSTKRQCIKRKPLIQGPVNWWKGSQENLWSEFMVLLIFRFNIIISTGFVCIQNIHRICMYLKCVCTILEGSLPLHKANQWLLCPTQTVSCKFGCSCAEDAYGVEALSKSEWSPVSNWQSHKFVVLFYDLDLFKKIGMSWGFSLIRKLPHFFFLLTNTLKFILEENIFPFLSWTWDFLNPVSAV